MSNTPNRPNQPTAYRDPVTGYEIRQLTRLPNPARKLYFSSEAWDRNDEWLFFISTPAAGVRAEVWRVRETDGELDCLTEDCKGSVHTGSFGLDRTRPAAYLQVGAELWQLDTDDRTWRAVAALPEGARPTGHLTAGKSGGLVNSYKLKEGIYALIVSDQKSGQSEIVFRSDTPLGHCQACPGDDRTVFYVHETGGDALQRMWHFDLEERRPRPYYVERLGEWITHETWSANGDYMTFIKAPDTIMIGDQAGHAFRTVAVSDFHHCAPGPSGRWIAADRTGAGEVVLVHAETGATRLLATSQGARRGEDHCHPSFNRAGDRIAFTSPKVEPAQIAVLDLRQIKGFAV